jgi:hypothetical protein
MNTPLVPLKKIFQIEEQTIEDPATGLRFEFSSIHSDDMASGNEAPGKDEIVLLRLWTSDRARMVTFQFERNGKFINAIIDPVDKKPTIT